MIKVALKGLGARKMRAALTTMAVVIGVAMITGAYVVSDTMIAASNSLSGSAYNGTDAVVTGKQLFKEEDTIGQSVTLPSSVLTKVRALPQVGSATGDITEQAKIVDKKGKPVGDGPYFAVGLDPASSKGLTPFNVTEGRYAQTDDEVVIDKGSADKAGYKVGDQVKIAAIGPVKSYELVGLTNFGKVESMGTATAAVFTMSEAQKMFRKGADFNSVLVGAREGVSGAQLRSSLKMELGPSVTVQSATKQDRFTLGGLSDFVGILQKILLAFGGVSVFVGAFIIFNTLSITVAQRIRELAMLRTVGADRRQVLGSVLGESVAMGIAGSAVGIAFGVLLAKGLQALFTAAGMDLPKVGMQFEPRTAIVAAVIGIGVTTIAALAPALKATRIEPVVALREGAELPAGKHPGRAVKVGFAITLLGGLAAGFGNLGSGLEIGERLPLIGLGSLLLFIGIAMLSPKFVKPLASLLGKPGEKIAGASGVLARRNAIRKPGRTASTAAAMMIGVALVTFVAVMASALRGTAEGGMRDQIASDYVISAQDDWSPISQEATGAAKSVKGVSVVEGIREDSAQLTKVKGDDGRIRVNGVDPAGISQVFHWKWKKGSSDESLRKLGDNGAIVLDSNAEDHGWKVGSPISVTSQSGKQLELTVVGITTPAKLNPLYLAEITVSNATFAKAFKTDGDRFAFVKGGDLADVKQALAPFPDAKVASKDQFIKDQMEWMAAMLAILYVMLALSVLVSLFGIVNTLALSVVERTREIGMLRAVGMTRRQTRRMVRHESIVTALIGATLGAVVGLFLGALTVGALASEGLSFVMPTGTLIAFVFVAVLAGTIAAIAPARRASRLDVLTALQYQ